MSPTQRRYLQGFQNKLCTANVPNREVSRGQMYAIAVVLRAGRSAVSVAALLRWRRAITRRLRLRRDNRPFWSGASVAIAMIVDMIENKRGV